MFESGCMRGWIDGWMELGYFEGEWEDEEKKKMRKMKKDLNAGEGGF